MILILASVSPAYAQIGGYSGEFSRMGFSPRGMAMGNAMTAVHHEGIYGYYNPALAAAPSENVQVDFSTAVMRFDRRLHMVTSHFRLPPMAGLSISLINAHVSDIDGRTQSGFHTETLTTAEFQLIGNFGLRFSERFWGGIGLKYNLADFHPEIPKSQTIGIDIGIRSRISTKLSFAIAMKDLLSKSNFDTSELYSIETARDRSQGYPLRYLIGFAWEHSDRLLVSLDAELRSQNGQRLLTNMEVINGFELVRTSREEFNEQAHFLRLGSSCDLHDRFTLRGGLQLNDIGSENLLLPSGGFSLHLPFDRFSPSIDYALIPEPNNISIMHVFALRLNI
jgi:hypothetical protein